MSSQPLFYSPDRVCKDPDVSMSLSSLNFSQFNVVSIRDKKYSVKNLTDAQE